MRYDLGTRMKEFYENRTQTYLPRRIPVIIRLDGKAFHTFTRGMNKPFDSVLIGAMENTALALCCQIQGCKMAYLQSDEISLLLTDWENLKTDAWFEYNIQKIVSIASSIATLEFNIAFQEWDARDSLYADKYNKALFDCRCFSLPKEEVNNYFLWRQQDATRNSIQMIAQSLFSHKQLQNKNTDDLQQMLFQQYAINFNDIETKLKRGSCCIKKTDSYNTVSGEPYTRRIWELDENIPIFKDDRNYIEQYLE